MSTSPLEGLFSSTDDQMDERDVLEAFLNSAVLVLKAPDHVPDSLGEWKDLPEGSEVELIHFKQGDDVILPAYSSGEWLPDDIDPDHPVAWLAGSDLLRLTEGQVDIVINHGSAQAFTVDRETASRILEWLENEETEDSEDED
jgi:hypothetical protein